MTGLKLTTRFERAFSYAVRLHAQQLRKSTQTPYIAHLMSVAALVIEDGGDEDEVSAALLHDAVEDQGGEPIRQEILSLFGERILSIVDGCTDSSSIPKPPWRERKGKYIESLRTAMPEVLRVSAADKLHNVRSILIAYRESGESLWARFHGGKSGTLWYYRQVTSVLQERGGGKLVDELHHAMSELEAIVAQNMK